MNQKFLNHIKDYNKNTKIIIYIMLHLVIITILYHKHKNLF
jgi:hypothetical protein